MENQNKIVVLSIKYMSQFWLILGESFTAVYDYNGQYEDELSFKVI